MKQIGTSGAGHIVEVDDSELKYLKGKEHFTVIVNGLLNLQEYNDLFQELHQAAVALSTTPDEPEVEEPAEAGPKECGFCGVEFVDDSRNQCRKFCDAHRKVGPKHNKQLIHIRNADHLSSEEKQSRTDDLDKKQMEARRQTLVAMGKQKDEEEFENAVTGEGRDEQD